MIPRHTARQHQHIPAKQGIELNATHGNRLRHLCMEHVVGRAYPAAAAVKAWGHPAWCQASSTPHVTCVCCHSECVCSRGEPSHVLHVVSHSLWDVGCVGVGRARGGEGEGKGWGRARDGGQGVQGRQAAARQQRPQLLWGLKGGQTWGPHGFMRCGGNGRHSGEALQDPSLAPFCDPLLRPAAP